jgi:2'-5' RNA ligase
MRCFIAVDLPAGVCAAIESVITDLSTGEGDGRREGRGADRGDVRWVVARNLHVTLKFLGSIPQSEATSVGTALRCLAAGIAPFTVRVTGLGMFPGARRARVIWVGLDGPPLEALAVNIDAALGTLGFARESRPFTPHITIGRVRSLRGWDQQLARVQVHASAEFGVSRVEEIVLYRSDLSPHGARYTAIDRLRLEGERE